MNFFDSGSAFNIFNTLALVGGLCLFLFGMNIMGQALERRAGNKLRPLLAKMTEHKFKGFLTGLGITSIIQSSSATTVMVVGFVNSGLMTLKQATNVIIGANVGTTVTGWILSLTGIRGDNVWVNMLKPSSFVPILALFGIVMLMMSKKQKSKDTGTILLGFATLMFGMEAMSNAVSGLAEIEGFRNLFIAFENPFLGILVGAALTCIIQSSSASVGILQALSTTGQVSIGASVPIVMGDGIGTCITAVISSIGAKREAKRAAVIHLVFNIIGTAFCMTCFCVAKYAFLDPLGSELLSSSASELTIAIANTAFKVASTLLILPMSGILEKIARKVLPATKEEKPETTESAEKDKVEDDIQMPEDKSPFGTYLLIALVAVGAAAGGYYFKVYKPKHEYDDEDEMEEDEDESEDSESEKREVDDADEQEESTEPEILRDEDFDDNVLEDEEEEEGR